MSAMVAAVFDPASYAWNAFALPLLVTAAAMFLLGVMVTVRERGSREAWQFAFLAATICIWLSCFSLMYLAKDARVSGLGEVRLSRHHLHPDRSLPFHGGRDAQPAMAAGLGELGGVGAVLRRDREQRCAGARSLSLSVG